MSDNERLYFYNGEWLPYQSLHDNHGVTLEPSTQITLYDDYLNTVYGWIENSTSYIWIVNDNQWYPPGTVPYWYKLDTLYTIYYIDKALQLETYKQGTLERYVYDNSFVDYQYLHDTYGMTATPSTPWSAREGVIWAWYNDHDNQYWNDNDKEWTNEAPPEPQEGGELTILPNPKPLVVIDQFADIEDPIACAGLHDFRFAYEYKTWTIGQLFKLVSTDIADPLQVYVDVTETGLSLYVINESGVTLQGVFYSYGSIINPVEKMTVWVEPEGTQVFYKGETLYTFSYLYDSLSDVTRHFWSYVDNRYYTSYELHEQGYSDTIAHLTSFKSTAQWGIEVDTGYVEGSLTDLINGSYYVDGSGVWVDIDTLALSKGLYPTNALDITLYKDLDTSRAAVLRDSVQSYYLVQEDLSYGWITRQEMEDLGWYLEPVYDYCVLDGTTFYPLQYDCTDVRKVSAIRNITPGNNVKNISALLNPVSGNITVYEKQSLFFEQLQPTFLTFKKQIAFNEIHQPALHKFVISVPCSLFVIDPDGITGIGGQTYPHGYEFNAYKRYIEEAGIDVVQYQCAELWVGWETKTDAQLEAMGLSLTDPNKIIIGKTTTIQGSTTGLTSDYYWVYEFNSTSSSNWYNSHKYATNPSPVTTGSQETVSSSGPYVEVELSDGGGNVYMPNTFRVDTYSSSPEIYFYPEVSALDSSKCGCIVKFNPNQYSIPFNLPSGLYSISGSIITWNTSHPLYILFEGKEAYKV
jgi:hypothetical protein